MELKELIARAAAIAGNQSRLARELETEPQKVTDWKNGRQACPLAAIHYMASMAKISDQEFRALMENIELEKHAGTVQGERLARVLGKLAIGALVTLSTFGASDVARAAVPSDLTPSQVARMYIRRWRESVMCQMARLAAIDHHRSQCRTVPALG
jgi:DNA-binding transcriptional regulator YdaS (Cro superfamily)